MRRPGEPVTCDDLLPISVEVRHKGKQGGVAQLHDPLQNLADLLGPQTSREGLPYRTRRPTAAPTVPPLKRSSELRARSGRTATAHKTGIWLSPGSKTSLRG